MAVHGFPHTGIADLNRSTVEVALNRARATRIDDGDDVGHDQTGNSFAAGGGADTISARDGPR
jgi:hypothetical protein